MAENLFKDTTNIHNNLNNFKFVETKFESELPKLNEYKTDKVTYHEGEIVCGKVGRYPWWPCMIIVGADGKIYKDSDKEIKVFVTYFGRIRDFSYLEENNILKIQSKMQLDNYVTSEIEKFGKKVLKKFQCQPRYRNELIIAWNQTEEALKMSLNDRIKKFSITQELLKKLNKNRKRPKNKVRKQKLSLPIQPKSKSNQKVPLSFGFSQLTLPHDEVRFTNKCCRYCLEIKDITECVNQCGSNFHIKCLNSLKNHLNNCQIDDNKQCLECSTVLISCHYCFKPLNFSKEETLQCSKKLCKRQYHELCVKTGPMNEMTKWTVNNKFICPRHVCHKCELVSPFPKYKVNKLVICIMCPVTYHTGDWCIPAGSVELTNGEIICPRHLVGGGYSNGIHIPPFIARVKSELQSQIYPNDQLTSISEDVFIENKTSKKPTNVNWCFKCGTGGVLVCCETCPAAYHYHCASLDEIPISFYCNDCVSLCYRNYGEIVWAKCGRYRWWPAQILHLANVPKNIAKKSHTFGQFVVQFFGSRDYLWIDQGKVFPYEENDRNNLNIDQNSKSVMTYELGRQEADKAFHSRELAWKNCESGNVIEPSNYIKIMANKHISRVKSISTNHQCDCNPYNKDSNSCSFEGHCINVELKYECDQELCKMKDRCQNQNFVNRNYPKQEIFWSGECGWALKTKEYLKKDQFVNEYVGEIIDIKEMEIRTEWANNNNYTDFYFMELGNNRVIDARNYSNLSRFMNHSCHPNLRAEKWLVKGEHRIGLFALRNINIDEELTFNYNLCTKSPTKIRCKCKSENCSGFLGDAPKKLDSRKSVSNKQKLSNVSKLKTAREAEESGSISKESVSTSCFSFSIEKLEKNCFRCSESVDDIKNIACTVGPCHKVYHAKCLDLNIKQYIKHSWICPWHYCDVCGKLSDKFCTICPTSFCKAHNTNSMKICATHD